MRSGIIAAAFAATAIAVPLQERAVVYATDVEMVYVTEYKTVTADGSAPAPSDTSNYYHFGHSPHWWKGPHKAHTQETVPAPEPTSEPEPEPTSAPEPAPAPTTSDWSQPAPTTEAPAPPAPSSPSTAPSDYQGKVLYHHNIHRKNHTAPDVQWSSSLAATAQKIAASCVYEHNTAMDGGGYGQNIAAGVDDSGIDRVITNMFYDSEVNAYEASSNDYQSSNPGNFETWGHMSQIVWINTAEVACVTQHCPNGLGNTGGNVSPYFTVCNYSPPGNVGGQYLKNVKKPIGDAPVYVS